ncbi:MAG TPA: arabinan endo-1,5-alpha-L-arabinosidase [Actinopolymorphaceae bacterium]|nr:arabinan endo-1,5-alpha-L-arabinosidase [Actinopolymorphaceae bacterium]
MRRTVAIAVISVLAAAVSQSSTSSSAQTGPVPTGARAATVATADVAPPPATLTGDLRTHDPALVREPGQGNWYVFSTGDPAVSHGTVQIRRSSDLSRWTYAGTVFDDIPAWVREAVPGVSNIWAPDVFRHDGTYYLYYAASTFGSNRSVIGLATNTTLDPGDPDYHWVDKGLVTGSVPDNDYNAIDPGIVEDADGTPWLAFGSFWSGIRMLKLAWPDGKPVAGQGEPLRLADRHVPPNAIEAPYIVAHDGWFYLFVSIDFCCRGTDSTYKIAVGRSRAVTGPYLDKLCTPLLHGGGTVLLSERGTMFEPGSESVFDGILAHHWYDGTAGGAFKLGLRRIVWEGGWPRIDGPGTTQ